MNHPSSRQHHLSVPVAQALRRDPTLGDLLARAARSAQLLNSIAPLIPPALREQVRPGPLDGAVWHVLVPHAAVATRLRYLMPAIEAHLRTKGYEVREVRIKVLPPQSQS